MRTLQMNTSKINPPHGPDRWECKSLLRMVGRHGPEY